MTPAERANPKIIDGSRRARISRGSGTQVSDVNGLVDRFFEARKMMMSMAKGGGMPGMPGMPGGVPGLGGARRPKAKQPVKKGRAKRVSGNPAKRAADQRAAAQRPANGAGANPFGVPGGADEDLDPTALDLPADLSKYLK
jgi:signal recognition particle subunit SRP54